MREATLHHAVADYLKAVLPPGIWWSTFPSGGGGRVRGALLKRAGLRAGVPDILIVHATRAIFLELKTDRGRLSVAQIEAHAALQESGALVATCRSIDDVHSVLVSWSVPLREANGGLFRHGIS